MRISSLIVSVALLSLLSLPVAALSQVPDINSLTHGAATQVNPESAIKSALQSVNLSPQQKLKINPMFAKYESQIANANPAAKQSAQQSLLQNIHGVLTPTQLTQFNSSLKNSLAGGLLH